DYPVSHAISHIVGMMETMAGWVDEIPALQQPMRFGNKAFRTWHQRLVTEAPQMMEGLLPAELRGSAMELTPYLTTAFGHQQRIDYGTGHETNFIVWLCCLHKLRILRQADLPAALLRCF
ncbi:unnamed protein product, partial [Phaeothamnion confervicola]